MRATWIAVAAPSQLPLPQPPAPTCACLQGHPASKGIEGEADMEDPLAAFGVHIAAFLSPCFPLPPSAPYYPAPLPERTCCGRATTGCRMR
eukprot:COSAG01_NODE_228_length_21104_cov_210.303832_23_plen_91_part_00